MLRHNYKKQKRFQCPDCGKAFLSNYYVKMHRKVHDQSIKKSLQCPECDKRYDFHSNFVVNSMWQLVFYIYVGIRHQNHWRITFYLFIKMNQRTAKCANSVENDSYHEPAFLITFKMFTVPKMNSTIKTYISTKYICFNFLIVTIDIMFSESNCTVSLHHVQCIVH